MGMPNVSYAPCGLCSQARGYRPKFVFEDMPLGSVWVSCACVEFVLVDADAVVIGQNDHGTLATAHSTIHRPWNASTAPPIPSSHPNHPNHPNHNAACGDICVVTEMLRHVDHSHTDANRQVYVVTEILRHIDYPHADAIKRVYVVTGIVAAPFGPCISDYRPKYGLEYRASTQDPFRSMPVPCWLECGTSCMRTVGCIPDSARSFPYEVPTSHSRMRVSSPAHSIRARRGCGRSSAQSRAMSQPCLSNGTRRPLWVCASAIFHAQLGK